ncbi:MAG TPA: hypothetical protein DGN59_04990 [Candidatus Latescibacteria bacterium]|nr:hypothetical protein [Candidatus Latescibacterota bacterium]
MSQAGVPLESSGTEASLRNATWHEVATLFLGSASLVGVVSLALGVFVPAAVLIGGTLVTVFVLWRLGERRLPQLRSPRSWEALVGAVAVLLRIEQWPNLTGGQDPGMYTNMAATMLRTGSVGFVDRFRQELPAGLHQAYDQAEVFSLKLVEPITSTFQIEFYPLHPLWMAVGESFVGGYGRHLSLLVFALFGITSGYLLALELDGRPLVARLFAGFLAVNPALVFFGKLPVAESLALAFALTGFLYIAQHLRGSSKERSLPPLLLAGLSFSSLVFVRWQVLLYLPALLLVAVGCLAQVWSSAMRRRLVAALTVVVAPFGIGLCYYAWRQPTLARYLGRAILDEAPHPALLLTALLLAVLVVLVVRRGFVGAPGLMHLRVARAGAALTRYAPWILVGALALSAWSIVGLYRTGVMNPWGDLTPVGDPFLFRFHSLYRLMLFVSPFGMLGLLAAPFALRRNIRSGVLCTLFSMVWIVALTRPFAPYLYYYGRYLVVDLLPVALLLVAMVTVCIVDRGHRRLGHVLAALVLVWSAFFSFVQLGHTEGEPQSSIERLTRHFTEDDVLLLSVLDQRLIVPLRVGDQASVFVIEEVAASVPVILELRRLAEERGGRLLLLTPSANQSRVRIPLATESLDDCFLTNTDHFRDFRHATAPFSLQRLLLPVTTLCNDHAYEIHDVSDSRTGISELIQAAADAGFFDALGDFPILQRTPTDAAFGTFDQVELGGLSIMLTDHLPVGFLRCEGERLCTEDGDVLHSIRVVQRLEGTSLFLAPVVADLGHHGNLLVSLDGAFVFGPSNATPGCDVEGLGSDVSLGSNWTMRSCSGRPALASTWVNWLAEGCTDELSGWYVCAG